MSVKGYAVLWNGLAALPTAAAAAPASPAAGCVAVSTLSVTAEEAVQVTRLVLKAPCWVLGRPASRRPPGWPALLPAFARDLRPRTNVRWPAARHRWLADMAALECKASETPLIAAPTPVHCIYCA